MSSKYLLTALDQLEAESIYIFRESVAQFKRPVLLFSGGKDSILMAVLAKKAFAAEPLPFPLMHIDTGHNFPETIEFRDSFAKKLGAKLIVRSVEDSIKQGKVKEETGYYASRNAQQSVTLLDAVAEHQFDAVFGGGRRDEEKARAKERIFSLRNEFGQWDPRNQRPEIWNLLNGRISPGEQMRIFPLSNWTEFDVWNYIKQEKIELPSLYFAHMRKCIFRSNGSLLANADFINRDPKDKVEDVMVRFRTIGDVTCTGALRSEAKDLDQVISEILTLDTTERGTRADDQKSDAAMEDRKKEGYF